MNFRFHKLWPWVSAALSGLLLSLSLPPANQTWLCWIALTPLIAAVWFSNETGKRVWLKKAALGYVAGLVFFTLAFKWLCSLAGLFENRWLLLLPALLSFYMGLYFAFWSWFIGIFVQERQFLKSRRNLCIACCCACAWVAQEWVRGWLFGGFGWNGLGVALHGVLSMIQIADITGVGGLSFLVAFTNIIAVITVRRLMAEIGRARLRPHYDFNLTMALVVVVFSYGVHTLLKKEESTPLRVAAIQANISQDEKFDDASERKIRERYTYLTKIALLSNPQLLLWPESSVPGGMFSSRENFDFVVGFMGKPGMNFLLGTDDFDANDSYNAAVLLTDDRRDAQTYHKIHLVPFGEYLPLRNSFPPFVWLAGGMVPGDFKAGTEYTILETRNPPLKIAPLVCFEDTLGDLTRRFVLKGAQVLVNVTNDGWFQKTEGAEQQLANAVFRTIETRRPLVRAANTGITCFVDSRGRVLERAKPFTESMLQGTIEIPKSEVVTFYVKYGEKFSIACFSITSAILGIFSLKLVTQKKVEK